MIMFNLADGSVNWMALIYCCLIVILGSFFMLNLILAVILSAHSKISADERKEEVEQY